MELYFTTILTQIKKAKTTTKKQYGVSPPASFRTSNITVTEHAWAWTHSSTAGGGMHQVGLQTTNTHTKRKKPLPTHPWKWVHLNTIPVIFFFFFMERPNNNRLAGFPLWHPPHSTEEQPTTMFGHSCRLHTMPGHTWTQQCQRIELLGSHYLSHIHSNVQWNLFTASEPSASEEQWAAAVYRSRSSSLPYWQDINPGIDIFDCWGNLSTRRKPAQTRGENKQKDLLAVRQQCRPQGHHAATNQTNWNLVLRVLGSGTRPWVRKHP